MPHCFIYSWNPPCGGLIDEDAPLPHAFPLLDDGRLCGLVGVVCYVLPFPQAEMQEDGLDSTLDDPLITHSCCHLNKRWLHLSFVISGFITVLSCAAQTAQCDRYYDLSLLLCRPTCTYHILTRVGLSLLCCCLL